MGKKIVILGAGITGRLAKIMFPEALVLESKSSNSLFTSEVGVCISIVPIPELSNKRYTRYIQIDNQKPSLELINKYKKKISREGDMSYGDYRQFESEQIVYHQELPQGLDIQFDTEVSCIDLDKKWLNVGNEIDGYHHIEYDYLISTIPLINLVQISNLFTNFKVSANTFFMHRPIYLVRTKIPSEPDIIRENYITDMDTPMYRENYFKEWKNQESLFKITEAIKIYPGKIYPTTYVSHILSDLESYKVFCAGRYACWDNRIHLWNVYSQLKFLRGVI